MSQYSYYFHNSGRIIRQTAVSDRDVNDLVELARQVADTSSAARGAMVLRCLINAFCESADCNSLRSDAYRDVLHSILDDIEDLWTAATWPEVVANVTGDEYRSESLQD
jgi:hypothetical protein